ncbi:MAG: 3-methyl-2-oxobutanoate hydroxymethyltransferase [Campylobacterales bacterium]|nr:3-methyl-2-oxobutanoate hydroxymethyltransferase [Campylobacterales bacterium]
MLSKQTITSLQKAKTNNNKLVMVTAYDALFAKLLDQNVDMILVGDSLNMSFAGKEDTLSATLDQMIYHTQAVCTGAPNTFVVCDMPFGTYTDEKLALESAVKVYQQTQAAAIKIEGGVEKAPIIKALTSNSIAVMGHIGLMPQFVRSEGGYKVKGKDESNIASLIEDAKAVEAAGAFAIVVEGVKSEAAKAITQAVSVPVIGIGAGKDVDGQVLVWSDMFGFFEEFKPKFVRQYLDGAKLIKDGLNQFNSDVKDGSFPNKDEEY